LLIRPATSADLSAMMALERDAPQAAHWSSPQYEAALGNSSPRRLSLLISAESTLENESQPQGFLVARELDGECEIENIVISRAVRRQGLGTRLLGAFLELARAQAATAVFLEVRESNIAARRLYEKAGFLHSGNRPLYYRDPPEGAILYRLSFL
jgi:[ribosomal protein S18]-alanine N-acetyltransferase